jgi:hypothetical protein
MKIGTRERACTDRVQQCVLLLAVLNLLVLKALVSYRKKCPGLSRRVVCSASIIVIIVIM